MVSERAMVERVREYSARYALLQPDDHVLVGCSGGADSLCLLHLLASGALGSPFRCFAVYVDHGLRADTRLEQSLVQVMAARTGAEYASVSVDVRAALRAGGGSVQDVARSLRYEALTQAAARFGANTIAVGHTRSDQAETVMLQLLRGAGTTGLSGIVPKRGRLVRPLLDVTRSETEMYCRAHDVQWFDDPSNRGEAYTRSRVRHELLPLLEQFNPRIEDVLARTAEIMRAEDAYLEASAADAFAALVVASSPGESGATLDVGRLHDLPLALARRVVRKAIGAASRRTKQPTFEQVEAVLALARSTSGSAEFRGIGDVVVRREYAALTFLCAHSTAGELENLGSDDAENVSVQIPGVTHIPWADISIDATLHEAHPGATDDPDVVTLDYGQIKLPIGARRRSSGDRMRPLGLGGGKKVSDIFTDAKVPRWERGRAVLIYDEEGIIWIAGHALDERVRVTSRTTRFLRLHAVRKVTGSGR